MRRSTLSMDDSAVDKILVIAIVALTSVSLISILAYVNLDSTTSNVDIEADWIDPVVEIEDANHSHSDLLAHRLSTDNIQLIDYHNLNCDGNEKPPSELDNVAGRPCSPDYKNVAPTPGDSSEIAIEGNFL
ncbi:MAG: hypothetical protein CMB49_03230, partial [Euryarchaeota archaeon]|nr:hypothetical protein [Euryarchaeota archaeon]